MTVGYVPYYLVTKCILLQKCRVFSLIYNIYFSYLNECKKKKYSGQYCYIPFWYCIAIISSGLLLFSVDCSLWSTCYRTCILNRPVSIKLKDFKCTLGIIIIFEMKIKFNTLSLFLFPLCTDIDLFLVKNNSTSHHVSVSITWRYEGWPDGSGTTQNQITNLFLCTAIWFLIE